ncbi:MAG: amidase [Actinomycetota bacterium]|nr:amidase [Actinomycetota bacterium]
MAERPTAVLGRERLDGPHGGVAAAGARPLTERSALELAAAIRAGEVSSRAVVDAHVERLERVNPRINAVVTERYEEARAEADAADARIAAAGADEDLPPLLGVPCTIKESLGLAGYPQCAGVVARRERPCERSSTIVERIVEAGAIPLGLTNVSELTLWVETENRVYGRTRNPYDPSRTAGGSSGGEGAAIGAGGSPFGLGTDFGGSIRLPAFFNGVFGHKPSVGVVPMTGHYPAAAGLSVAPFSFCGPLARRAEDLIVVLRAIAGPDGEDELIEDVDLGDPGAVDLDGLRVVVSESGTLGPTGPELAQARERAAGALAAAGARLERVDTKSMKRALEMYLATAATTETTLAELLADAGADPIRWRDVFRRGGPHTVATRIAHVAERIAERVPEGRTRKVLAARESFARELSDTIGDGVLLHPPAPKVAPKHGGTVGRLWWIHPMLVFNLTGLPVTQVPLGLNDEGLPLGVQVVAGHGRDHMSIAVAQELERVFGGWVPPPTSPARA